MEIMRNSMLSNDNQYRQTVCPFLTKPKDMDTMGREGGIRDICDREREMFIELNEQEPYEIHLCTTNF